MGMSAGGKGGIKSDINVTPLVDVVLVLLIIFMVITPMLQKGKSVTLPTTQKEKNEKDVAGKQQEPIYVSVTPDGKMFFDQEEVSAEDLQQRVFFEIQNSPPGRKVMLKGDQSLKVGDVVKAMDTIRMAKAKSVHLAIEEKK